MKKALLLLLSFVFLLSGCGKVVLPPTVETGIDLYGTYDQNDLLITEITQDYNDTEVKIPQLDGLKNAGIQNEINKDIYSRAMALVKKYPAINYANYYTYASFANVISISFHVGFDEPPYAENIYFNYNLVDGSVLMLEDLFRKDTDLLNIVRSAVYREMSVYGEYNYETGLHSLSEEKLYRAVKNYMSSSDKRFAFSPSRIYFYPQNSFAEIKMADYANEITIYSKFLTDESIFTGEYSGFKNAFTCSDTQYDMFDVIEYGYLEDNLWYDFTVTDTYIPFDAPPEEARLEKFEAFRQRAIENERLRLNDAGERAKANPDKFYIILIKPYVSLNSDSYYKDGTWHYTYFDTASFESRVQLFEMPIELHETLYKDKIIETYRYDYFAMRGGAYLETENLDGVTLTETVDSYTYNYITDQKED